MSSIDGAKVTYRDMCPMGKTTPPQSRRVSWSLVVSQRTEQKRDYRVRFRISVKEKMSARSERASISTSWLGGGFCKNCFNLQAMRNNSPLAVVEDYLSRPECQMPSWWVRMSTATYREAHASNSEYLGVVSSVGSEVRQVVTQRISLGFLSPMGVVRKRDFRRFVTSPGVRW